MVTSRKRRPLVAVSDVSEAASFAAGLSESHLLCRELGHLWAPFTARLADGGGFERVLRCQRCRTERWQLLNSRGGVVTNNYKYAEGYQHKGHGRIVGDGRDALRLESLHRVMDKPATKSRRAS